MILLLNQPHAPRLYAVIAPASGWVNPTGLQILNGRNGSGAPATWFGGVDSPTANTTFDWPSLATGLTPGTQYRVAVVWYDGSSTSNVSVSDPFTTGSGATTQSGAGLSQGTSGANATSQAIASASGSSSGAAVGSAVGSAIASASGASSGSSSASGAASSGSVVSAAGSAAGSSSGSAVGASTARSAGSSAGSAVAAASGAATASASSTVSAASSAAGVGRSVAGAAGASAGSSSASAAGRTIVSAAGFSSGTSFAFSGAGGQLANANSVRAQLQTESIIARLVETALIAEELTPRLEAQIQYQT